MSDSAQRNNRLATALDLASKGIPCFPFRLIGDDKIPVIKDWANAASTDPDQLMTWFDNGSGFLIGVPTGARSGIDVIDVDPRHGGDRWVADHPGLLPRTRTHLTKRGGSHLVLQHRPGMRGSQNRVGQGVDVLGDGNFMVWWPAEGLIVANDNLIADWTEELAELATNGRANGASDGEVPLERRRPPSARHVVALLIRLPNPLAATRDDYLSVMLGAKGCLDALAEAGTPATLDEEEAIVDAAVAWAQRWEGHDGTTDEFQKWTDDWSYRDARKAGWQSLQHVAARLLPGYADEIAAEEFRQAEPPPPPPPPKPNRFRPMILPGLWTRPPPQWLVPDVLTEHSLAELYSPHRSFKSFVAIGWAFALATGTPWCGRAVKQCDVLYIVAEGVAGTVLRTKAWCQYHELTAPPLNLRLIPLAVNLMDPHEVQELIRAVIDENTADGFNPGLVIVDTLHRSMAGGDENSAQDIGTVVDNAVIVQRQLACTVLLVHHAGKDLDRGSRGSSGLAGAMDTIVRSTRKDQEDCFSLVVEKQKDAEDGQEIFLRAVRVVLPTVDPLTSKYHSSLVIIPDGDGATRARRPGENTNEGKALRYLEELIEAGGVMIGGHRCVPTDRWRQECEIRGLSIAKDQKSRNLAFRRAVKALLEQRLIGEADGLSWVV